MMQAFGSKKMGWMAGFALAVATVGSAAGQSDEHGRKWKPLPPTSHIVVTVLKGFNGKPLMNAAVVFHATLNGRNDGNLEVKTDEEGKATIDVIEVGSHLTVQVIANGFATSATEMDVDGPSKELQVKMLRPRAQISNYQDNDGKAADVKPGVIEPNHPATGKGVPAAPASPQTPTATPTTDPTAPTAVPVVPPASTAPPKPTPNVPPSGLLQ